MRITAGLLKGRRLEGPGPGLDARPTLARARRSLFDFLVHGPPRLELGGLEVIDLFAGSGALGFEALSRGAARVLFVERDPQARRLIRRNASRLALLPQRTPIRARPARLAAKPLCAGLVFADPPYGQNLAAAPLDALAALRLLAPGAYAVIQERKDLRPTLPKNFTFLSAHLQARTRFILLRFAPLLAPPE